MTDHIKSGAELLLKAADLLEEQGWCRGNYRNSAGHHCAVGALKEAAYRIGRPMSTFDVAFSAAERALTGDDAEVYVNLISWNDQLRDKRYVTRLFRRAARQLQAAR